MCILTIKKLIVSVTLEQRPRISTAKLMPGAYGDTLYTELKVHVLELN